MCVVARPGEIEAERGGNRLTFRFREVQRSCVLGQECPSHRPVIRLLLAMKSPRCRTLILEAEKDFDIVRIAADAKCQAAAWRCVDRAPMPGAQSPPQSRLVRCEVENPCPARLYRSARRRMRRCQCRERSRSSRLRTHEIEGAGTRCIHRARKRANHRVARHCGGAVGHVHVARKTPSTNSACPHPLFIARPDDFMAERSLDALPQSALQEVSTHALQRDIPVGIGNAGVSRRCVMRR